MSSCVCGHSEHFPTHDTRGCRECPCRRPDAAARFLFTVGRSRMDRSWYVQGWLMLAMFIGAWPLAFYLAFTHSDGDFLHSLFIAAVGGVAGSGIINAPRIAWQMFCDWTGR